MVMRRESLIAGALPAAQRVRLRALAQAAEGCDWESREVIELVRYYHSLVIPWHVRGYVGGHALMAREIGCASDVARFVDGMQRLARCLDFGEPYPCRACIGCGRRTRMGELLGQFFTFEEQEAFE